MKRGVLWLMGLGLCLATASSMDAGGKKEEPPKPGAEHKVLAGLEGTFNTKVKAWLVPGKDPDESTGTLVRKMILDGRYLQENHQGTADGKPFAGMSLIGFDLFRKKYVLAWVDSLSSGIMYKEGDYNAQTKRLTYLDELDGGGGKKLKLRDTLTIISANEQLFESFRQLTGEKEVKTLEIRYIRKK